MEAYKVIGILRIKDQNGEWQEIQAIKGDQGNDGYTPQKGIDYFDGEDYVLTEEDKKEIAGLIEGEIIEPDLSNYATIDYVDNAIANIDIPEVDLSEYSTTTQMNEAIAASKYRIGQGLAYNQNNNMLQVAVVNSGRLVLNNGALDVNQNFLFNRQNQTMIINNEFDGGFAITEGVNSYPDIFPMMDSSTLSNWVTNIQNNPRPININLRMGEQAGFSNSAIPVISNFTPAPNGTAYPVLFDMSAILGPNIQSGTGITQIFLGFTYDTNMFDLIIVSNGTAIPPITILQMSEVNSNPSCAHFWPDNAFRRYNSNGLQTLGLNDDYINNLIDNKFSSIGVAEEVEV